MLHHLLSKAGIEVKQQLEELLQNKAAEEVLMENLVFPMIETNDQALWSLLLYAGYLKVLSTEIDHLGQLRAQIAIPNKEVSFVYYSIVRDWLTIPSRQKSYDVFINSLIKGDMGQFEALLSTYIIQTGSYFDFKSEYP